LRAINYVDSFGQLVLALSDVLNCGDQLCFCGADERARDLLLATDLDAVPPFSTDEAGVQVLSDSCDDQASVA
jgi:anti-anti-sigma regulatory factor